jgi:hypothetical protein
LQQWNTNKFMLAAHAPALHCHTPYIDTVYLRSVLHKQLGVLRLIIAGCIDYRLPLAAAFVHVVHHS